MRIEFPILALAAAVTATPLAKRAVTVGTYTTDGTLITAQQYSNFVRYAKFCTAALQDSCNSPNGASMVSEFSDTTTDTQGYVARDDAAQEVIIALRSTQSIEDILTDIGTTLVQCTSPGVPYPTGALCHTGFQAAYNAVAATVISLVAVQLAAHPGYKITVAGHSLGAALASLGGLSMKHNFKNTAVTMYNYGQPRTGDINYAAYFDASFPLVNGQPTAFRSTHAKDGVPEVIRQGETGNLGVALLGDLDLLQNNPKATAGYWHHSTEFWQLDPPSQATTIRCVGQEDLTCRNSLTTFTPLLGISVDHLTYYGVGLTATDPTWCH